MMILHHISGTMISWRTVITQMATRLWNSPSWVSYQWDLTCKWGTIQTAQDTLCLVMIVFQLFQSRRQSISGLTWHCTRVFMILLFLFSLSFWINALFHIRVLSVRSDPFQELHMIIQNDIESGQKTFAFTQKSESSRGILLTKTKTSKSPVAFSLTCTLLWPERWPPEPPSWSLLSFQESLRT